MQWGGNPNPVGDDPHWRVGLPGHLYKVGGVASPSLGGARPYVTRTGPRVAVAGAFRRLAITLSDDPPF